MIFVTVAVQEFVVYNTCLYNLHMPNLLLCRFGMCTSRQESLANAKVSARQQCDMEVPSKEIYRKSAQAA